MIIWGALESKWCKGYVNVTFALVHKVEWFLTQNLNVLIVLIHKNVHLDLWIIWAIHRSKNSL